MYGTWSDNRGNTISFYGDDNSFSAKIGGMDFSGYFTVLLNALTLKCSEPVEQTIVSEWDIDGNILHLSWVTAEDEDVSLTLFKVSN